MKNTQTTNTQTAANISSIIESVFGEYDSLTIKDLHITYKHTGKMNGMISISTSSLVNDGCFKKSLIKGSICSKCYARKQLKRYKNQDLALIRNTMILTSKVYPVDQMPFLNAAFVRFESFGDLNNVNQFTNYVNIALRNPHCTFVIWSKNPHIIADAFNNGIVKPENVIIIYSSFMVNGDRQTFEQVKARYPFIDKVFTVYDKKTIAAENININCGARSCIGCMRCYRQNTENVINEQLK